MLEEVRIDKQKGKRTGSICKKKGYVHINRVGVSRGVVHN